MYQHLIISHNLHQRSRLKSPDCQHRHWGRFTGAQWLGAICGAFWQVRWQLRWFASNRLEAGLESLKSLIEGVWSICDVPIILKLIAALHFSSREVAKRLSSRLEHLWYWAFATAICQSSLVVKECQELKRFQKPCRHICSKCLQVVHPKLFKSFDMERNSNTRAT